jgi:hypothetical protein
MNTLIAKLITGKYIISEGYLIGACSDNSMEINYLTNISSFSNTVKIIT